MHFEELLQHNNEHSELNKSIIELEKIMLETAPDDIKKIYLQIDFLCQKQKNIELDLLKKYLQY